MPVSINAINLIKEFEGLFLKAYLDPVGIPTIGYGTIRYPNGKKVAMGDQISEAEAEAFMQFESNEMGAKIAADLVGVQLNQNQFDALVSFCYNVGMGAFNGSTLRQKIKQSKFAEAADEFGKWNKATENGVKKVLAGLTRRRASESALFLKGGSGAASTSADPSNREKVTKAKGFRSGQINTVVAYDDQDNVMEIVDIDSRPSSLRAALDLFPKLMAFDFAAKTASVPQGEHIDLTGDAPPIVKVKGAPKLHQSLMALGSEDGESFEGNNVRDLQSRLKELGYFNGAIDGQFGKMTDAAVKEFQSDYFGASEADGLVGPKTWDKLWGDAKPNKPQEVPVPAPAPGKNYLRLTKTNSMFSYGCYKLVLAYFKDGQFANSIEVNSGQARKQTFRIGKNSPTGSMEPLPEGKWQIGDIEWADGKDNFSGAVWNNGLGPAKIRLEYEGPGKTPRSAIEIHIDWNRSDAPGTAGCIGVQNVADFKKLVGWLRETDPRGLFVDYGLGTCPKP